MMMEFEISFQFNDRSYKANVVKSHTGERTDYAVRPIDTFLVREYGKQTLIFKEQGVFSCDSLIDSDSPGYVDAIVNAIRDQDAEEAE